MRMVSVLIKMRILSWGEEAYRDSGIIPKWFWITAALRVGRYVRSSRTSCGPVADGSGLLLPLDGEDAVIGENRTRYCHANSAAPPPFQFSIRSWNNSRRKEAHTTGHLLPSSFWIEFRKVPADCRAIMHSCRMLVTVIAICSYLRLGLSSSGICIFTQSINPISIQFLQSTFFLPSCDVVWLSALTPNLIYFLRLFAF